MSKLGIHVVTGSRNGYGPFCASIPSVAVAVNEGGALQEVKAKSGGRTITVFRDTSIYLEAPVEWNQVSDMVALARRYYPLLKAKWQLNLADYYTLTNEQGGGGDDAAAYYKLIAYETELMRLANANGLKVCVLNLAGGSPGDFEFWKATCVPLIAAAFAAGNIYGRHAYGAGDLVDASGKVIAGNPERPLKESQYLYGQGHRGGMVITEAGIDGGMGFGGIVRFCAQMEGYEQVIQNDPMIIGAAAWTLGDWQGANCQDAMPRLTQYNINNPPDSTPEPVPCRGRPREQYRRSYVLLSPGLDETWAIQALKGSWPKRLTVGASADDAGLGDLDVRNVLAINPAGWSGDLRAFYEQYYPGINYIPIVTMSPFQMRQYLQSYNPTTAAAPTLPAFTATHWPTDYRAVNQPFGVNACNYCEFGLDGHEGIDAQAPLGSNVYAIAPGQVYLAVTNPGTDNYGIQVRIRHSNGFWSVYAHLQSIGVAVGQSVQGGQLIAKADSTGNSSGSHLHLGLGHDEADPGERMHVGMGRYVDPWPYLQPLFNPTGNAGIGLHAPADPVFTQGDFAEFDALRPNWIKVLSSHSFADINRLAAAHPTASFVVRAFLSFWQNGQPRNISPSQFVTDTINDVRRAVDAIAAAAHSQVVIVELGNEPNLYQEGLGGAWQDGNGFSSWFLDVLGRYRALLPQVKYAFPGLSPGPTVPGVRLDHVAFMSACLGAAASADRLAIHAYWNSTAAPLSTALAVVDGYIAQVPNKPILITEASNNQSGNAEIMSTDYVTFWQELRKRPRVQGVMYFVVNASNPEFAPELWTPRQLGAKVRAKMP